MDWNPAEPARVQDDSYQLSQRRHTTEGYLQPSLLAAVDGCVPTSWHSWVGLAGMISNKEGPATGV
jgi:hypothetical protein